jgi:hypothetical protein
MRDEDGGLTGSTTGSNKDEDEDLREAVDSTEEKKTAKYQYCNSLLMLHLSAGRDGMTGLVNAQTN